MTRREPSLFTRLAVLFSLLLALGVAALVSAAWIYARAAANEAYDRLLLGAALQISEALTVQNGALTLELPTSAFEMLALSARDRIFYRVIDARGVTLTGYDELGAADIAGRTLTAPTVVGSEFLGEPVRIAVVSRALSDLAVGGRAQVLVAQTEESRRELARELTYRALVLVALMSLLMLGGAAFAIRYALSPVKRLTAVLRQRDPNDLTPLAVSAPRELHPFVASINYFMERLNARLTLLQRFIADAAHQIRTPLTALSAQVELLAGAGGAALDERAQLHLRRVQDRTSQLARLTNQILSHAMVIHRAEAMPLDRIDLVEIARRALRDAVPVSLGRDLLVAIEAPGHPVIVVGDRVSVREALANVIDNAVRHGAPSRLDVRIHEREGTVEIEVHDDGKGIPPEQWERVTQRFGGGSSGGGPSGLGFAIAAEVMKAHGGQLIFREPDETGFTVSLIFPQAEAPTP